LKIQDVFNKYIDFNSASTTGRSSLGTHRGKIKKYINFTKNADINLALIEKNLREFIFDIQQQPAGKYDALSNFYKFYYEKILKMDGRETPIFPIDVKEVKQPSSEGNKKRGTVYFPLDFDFNELFDDKHYHHLHNENAKLTVKAAISLALSAGYDSGEMFPTNTRSNKSVVMTLENCLIEDDYIKVKNFYVQSMVPSILIRGENAKYIRDYYTVRKKFQVKHAGQNNNFIAHIWETSELDFDYKIVSTKPYNPYQLLSYMLKYITKNLGLDSPVVTDLRSNMVLHSLYHSKGASLRDIIELYGYPPFVQQAFEEYCTEINRNEDNYFSPLSFDIARNPADNDNVDSVQDEKKGANTGRNSK
jgi:hypothetical protein